MILPTRNFLIGCTALLPATVLTAAVSGPLLPVWVVLCALAGAAFSVDAWSLRRAHRISLAVNWPTTLPVSELGEGRVDVDGGRDAAGLDVTVRIRLPLQVEPVADLHGCLDDEGLGALRFPIRAHRRGTISIEALTLRCTGRWRLVHRTRAGTPSAPLAVIPDIHRARTEGLRLIREDRILVGIKTAKYAGEGSSFDSLRDHRVGDDLRALDWRSSARHRKLRTREYRAEHNQQIVIALDCGHLMGEPVDGIPKLDHAIRNGLLLSLVSLAAGDRVGLFAFDSRIRNWLPPRNGVTSFASFQRACSALDYGNDETNFTLGLADLSTRLTRRSLIIVFTDFVDTITAGLMVEQLTRMRQRHLIIFVALGDPWLEQTATQTVADTKSLQAAVVAHDLSNDRKRVHRELDRRGISSIDVTTAELGPAVIDRYLTIKRRGLL